MVPKAEAIRLPPTRNAATKPITKWKPMNGVNDAKTPAAKPAAMACGDAFSRLTRCQAYPQARRHPRRGQSHANRRSWNGGFVRRLNNISIYQTGERRARRNDAWH